MPWGCSGRLKLGAACSSCKCMPAAPVAPACLPTGRPSCSTWCPCSTNYPQWIPWKPEDATMRFRFVVRLEGGEGPQPPQPAAQLPGEQEQAAAAELEQPAAVAVGIDNKASAAESIEQPVATAANRDAVPQRAQQLEPKEQQVRHMQPDVASSTAGQQAAGSQPARLASQEEAVAAAAVAHIDVRPMTMLGAVTVLALAVLWALGAHRRQQRRFQRDGSGGGPGKSLRLAHSGHASSHLAVSGAGCSARSSSQQGRC